jgi:hypothetical protein
MNFGIQHTYFAVNTTILNLKKKNQNNRNYSEVTNEHCHIPNNYVRQKTSEVVGPDSECDNILDAA